MESMQLVCEPGDVVRVRGCYPIYRHSIGGTDVLIAQPDTTFRVMAIDEYDVALHDSSGDRILMAMQDFAVAFVDGDIVVCRNGEKCSSVHVRAGACSNDTG